MPVKIGVKSHDFSEPTALLSDCHRRIEMFLEAFQRVGSVIDRPLGDDARAALASAVRYFREAAPKHTADEEQSLFPRMRSIDNPDIANAISKLNELEGDHRRADALHAEVDALATRCLEQGHLSVPEAACFRRVIDTLSAIYHEHIRIEDTVIFPAANQILTSDDKSAIASEMANRRRATS